MNLLFIFRVVYDGFELETVRKYKTPYGARLVWDLLREDAKLVVHLKDKKMIRNRKRWSQVHFGHYKELKIIHFARIYSMSSVICTC